MDTTRTMNPTTHPAQARELARELREAVEREKWFAERWHQATPGADLVQEHGLDIAATLDALADENERLREALDATTEYASEWQAYHAVAFARQATQRYTDNMSADIARARALLSGVVIGDAMQTDS